MRTMKTLINILLILAVIAALVATGAGLARRLASENADTRALAALLEKNAALRARITSLKTAPPAPRQTGAGADATDNKAASDNRPVRLQGPWGSSETREYRLAQIKALEEHKLNDTEFGLKYYAALRADVSMQYGTFYHMQQLTKEQTDVLAEALFQRALRYDQAGAVKQAGGADADAQAARAGADAELAAAAQEALGADLYELFALYERQRPAWDYVEKMGGLLSLVDIPLSVGQASRLVAALGNASTSFQNGASITDETVDWNAVDAAVADFLTPAQLDFFKNTFVSGDTDAFGGHSGLSRQARELNAALEKSGFGGRFYQADSRN